MPDTFASSRSRFAAFASRVRAFLRAYFGAYALAASALLALASGFATAQAQPASYQVLSVSPTEVLVRIEPHYTTQTVYDTSGYAYTAMSFAGGVLADSAGTQGLEQLRMMFLTPSRTPAEVQIVNQSLEVLPSIDLAPVPTVLRQHGDLTERYIVRDAYYTTPSPGLVQAGPVELFRTAFAEPITVSPISYDPSTRSITRIRSLTLRIRLSNSAATVPSPSASVTAEEASTFRAVFINGGEPTLYACALNQHAGIWAAPARTKSGAIALNSPSDTGEWLEVTTTAEGVYRITAQDLSNAGVSGSVDPNTIELLGDGGAMLSESVTNSSGEWSERPIEVHANGGTFQELRFYSPGTSVWKYSTGTSTHKLAHTENPYTSSGHFLLHIGGTPVAAVQRVITQADSLSTPAVPATSVLAATVHDVDHLMESENVGREMLDQSIPRADQPPLSITLDAPGFAGGPSFLRVAWDGAIGSQKDPESGYVTVQMNGQTLGKLDGVANTGNIIDRNWDRTLTIGPSIQPPFNVGLAFTSTSVTATSILDYVELVYNRSLDIGSQSIPFFLVDTAAALSYQFTNAAGGELWDVTDLLAPRVLGTANGNSISVSLQGASSRLRRFIAFSAQSLLSPALSQISAPSLRTTIGQQGAAEIIVAPQAFIAQAKELAALREEGGQATEAMSAAVVTIEDIYREFGYGNSDVTALRDFMAYTFRHATTRPSYLTLLGGGHCDYQNRETTVPDWLPPYESVNGDPFPSDDYFVDLTGSPANLLTLAVGRISARNADDAETYVRKVREYEHASDSGSWRSLTTFLADDHYDPDYWPGEDPLTHFEDTQNEIAHLQDRVLVHKIYESSYPTTIDALGNHRKPQVNTDVINAFNSGTVLFSFVGHGNPEVWAHESVLNVPSSINAMSNFDRLAYVTTATCDFSRWDDFSDFSGGEQFLMSPIGGAIGLLGTSRSVTSGEPLVQWFYQTLFHGDSGRGTSTVGQALIAGKMNGNLFQYFYLLGDPAQRLLLPKLYVSFDSLNGAAFGSDTVNLAALSEVEISGSIRPPGMSASVDHTFNGTVTVTLYDTPTKITADSYFPDTNPPFTVTDTYDIEGPILFRGTATVTDGRFTIKFIVPRDIKLDSGQAKLSGYAYSAADSRTALGDNRSIALEADTALANVTTGGPSLKVWIGSRLFQNGDRVSCHNTAIVDVADRYGLNTSTASIGHSFIAWVDNAMDSAVDMASTYVSKPNSFDSGTSVHAIELPAGHHTLHVRAFDTYDNPSSASVDFVAVGDDPYRIYNVTAIPNPLSDHTIFSFVQPSPAGDLVNVTLSLYSTDGALIRTLTASSRGSNIEIPWDGRDAGGTNVANGAYFFNVNVQDAATGASSIASGKCVVEH